MITNFFKNIADLRTIGNLNITIQQSENGKLTVSVLLTNPKAKENAVKAIPPLLLKGTAQELDEGFFDAVIEPLQQTDGLLQNMVEYQKGQEKAKSNGTTVIKSKISPPKDDIEITSKPNKEEKKKEYSEAIRKIVELTGLCKFAEALAILPSVAEFPDKETELLKRKADLERMDAQKQLLWND